MKGFRYIAGALSFSLIFGVAVSQRLGSQQIGVRPSLPPPAVGTWQRTQSNPAGNQMGTPLLLTNGTVIMQDAETSNWFKLTPDNTGSYQKGTWSQIASMPTGYAPLYFASAVLPDGRVVVAGGEYNISGDGVWTNLAALYDPQANTWVALPPPPGWGSIGDAQCVVMPNGRLLLADLNGSRIASFDPVSLTWVNINPTGKNDRQDEEGWTLMPDGTLLTCSAIAAPAAQRYIPALNTWISASATPQSLEDPGSQELGPMVLRPNGTVFAMGATGHNAVYTPGVNLSDPGSWVSAPDFPIIGSQLDIADGPACLLPNGNVLCDASPGLFHSPSHFFEFDGTSLNAAPSTPRANGDSSFIGNMLMLPTGQVLFNDFSRDVELYTPSGGPLEAWRPTITSCPTTIQQGMTFTLSGTQLNGLSQCSAYGDDSSNATNYPLVRITNNATGHVTYTRTHDHSTMAVATGAAVVSTIVDVPAGVEIGPSTVQVVTNGIPSLALAVNIVAPHVVLPSSYSIVIGTSPTGSLNNLFYADNTTLGVNLSVTGARSTPFVKVQFTGTSPTITPTSIQVTATANIGAATPVSQVLSLYNFLTQAYEDVDTRQASVANQTVTVAGNGDLSRFVNPITGEIRAQLSYTTPNFTGARWLANIDQLNWIIQ